MVRPLKLEMLGPRKIRRVPEAVPDLEGIYESLNSLYTKGHEPRKIIKECERLLTVIDRISVRQDPCEILSDICDKLEEIEI